MALEKTADRVAETTITTGTGTISLAGARVGYQTFAAGIGDGNGCQYTISDGLDWETGWGVVAAGSPATLMRVVVEDSSNGGAAVDFSAGTKTVWHSVSATKFKWLQGGVYFADPNETDQGATGNGRSIKALVDAMAYIHGVGNLRRVYETAAEGWKDIDRNKTANPFRLFFKKPKD